MTTVSTQFVPLTADEFRGRLREALAIYVEAMRYPPGTAEQRAPMWLTHALRVGWRGYAALDAEGTLLGVAYGYRGNPGQWWHEHVRSRLDPAGYRAWLSDCFEVVELHVAPGVQGQGIGEQQIRLLLDGVNRRTTALSTPEGGESRAWRLYRRLGFLDVLRNVVFPGDDRPFAVLGRGLPLEDPTP